MVKNVLPAATFSKIAVGFTGRKEPFCRAKLLCRGSAFDGTDLRANCPEVVDALSAMRCCVPPENSPAFQTCVLCRMGMSIKSAFSTTALPEMESAGMSMATSTSDSVGRDSHHRGAHRRPDSKLETSSERTSPDLSVSELENTLILFQGDQVHRVRPMADGEERLVINLLLTTDPRQSVNPFLKGYQSLVNYFFYGRLRSGFQIEDDFSASKSKPNMRY